ncbi:glutathione binding-like protein [Marinobacter algicola]|uniref:glutathione binding-like protein n=1 Tax=Marinobacter algicola TaxID=236100 RepID=UPI000A0343BD
MCSTTSKCSITEFGVIPIWVASAQRPLKWPPFEAGVCHVYRGKSRSSNTVHVAYAQIFRPERFVTSEINFPPVKESGRSNYEQCLTDIEKELQYQDYAIGTQFSVVDPLWLVFYWWGVRANFDMGSKFPVYTAYAKRLCSRSSVQKALTNDEITIWK